MNFHVWNRGLKNQTEKVPCTVSLNVPKFLSSLCLQGLFQTFIGCDYCTQSSALSFEKNIFIRNGQNDIYLWCASRQNTLFSENLPLKTYSCPQCLEQTQVKYFFVFNTHSVRNLHRTTIASFTYNVGAARKLILCSFNFQMLGVYCSCICL